MKNSQHTSKTITYTQQRLKELGISKIENQLTNGQPIFQAYYYNRMEDEVRHLSQKEIDIHLTQKKKYDNILIHYGNIWGEPLRHRSDGNYDLTGNIYHQEPDNQTNGRKWATPILRLRIHEKNRYPIKNIAENQWKISPKYRTPKNSQIDIFFNGIYQYFIKPLLQKGFDKKSIIQQIKRLFQKICITEGEFKAYYACKLGIPTLGIGGIHSAVKTIKQTFKSKTMEEYTKTIGASFLKNLSDFLQLFEVQKIIFLQDSDAFDNRNNQSRALGSFYSSIRNFFFAVKNFRLKHYPLQMDYAFILPNKHHKQGLDDLLLAHPKAIHKIKQDLFSPVHHLQKTYIHKWSIQLQEDLLPLKTIFEQSVFKMPIFAYRRCISKRTLKKRKTRLTKILEGIDLNNKRLYAPTGTGKTYLVDQLPGRKILICSTIALLKNAASEYGFLPFSGEYKDLEAIKEHPKIVTTYASFRTLSVYLKVYQTEIAVYIDEAHNFSSATSPTFQLKQMWQVLDHCQSYKSVTLLTGTETFNCHPFLNRLPIVEVQIPKASKSTYFIDAKEVLKTTAEQVHQSIKKGRFPIVLFDNTSEQGKLGTLKKLIHHPQVCFFNAQTKTNVHFQQVITKGIIAPNVKGIVTTSVLKEGVNIYNTHPFDIIVAGSFHSAAIEQISNRPRSSKDIRILIIRNKKRKHSDADFRPEQSAWFWEKKCYPLLNEMNVPDMNDSLLDQELYTRKFIQTFLIRRNPTHQQFELDQLQLNHQVYENQRIAENRNDDLMKKQLAKYQIIFKDLQHSDLEQTAEEKANTKAARISTKDQQKKDYQEALNQLKSRPDLLAYCQKQHFQNKNLSPIERKIYSRFQQLQTYSSNSVRIVEHLAEAGLSDSKFRLLHQRIHIYLLKSDSDYMQSNRLFVIVLKSIYSQFQDGEIISSQEIKHRLKQSLQLDRSFDIAKKLDQDKRQVRALKITRLFFKVERTTTKINKKTKTLFRIGRLSFDCLFNNIMKTKAANNPKKIYEKIEHEILVNEIGFDATHIKLPISK